MSIAGYNTKITSVAVIDPAATLKVTVLKAPQGGLRIHNMYAACSAAIASHATNIVTATAIDGGANGAGTTSMGTYGGADTAWLANNLNALTLTQTKLDEGDVLIAQYSEGGTVGPGTVTFSVEWSQGGDE